MKVGRRKREEKKLNEEGKRKRKRKRREIQANGCSNIQEI